MKLRKIFSLILAIIFCFGFASCTEKPATEELTDETVAVDSSPAEGDSSVPELLTEENPDSVAGLTFEGYNYDEPPKADEYPAETETPNEPYAPETAQCYFISFRCYVNEITDTEMIVNPVKNSNEDEVVGEISIPLSAISDDSLPCPGDCYEVHYKGEIIKTSPATLQKIISVEIVSSAVKE